MNITKVILLLLLIYPFPLMQAAADENSLENNDLCFIRLNGSNEFITLSGLPTILNEFEIGGSMLAPDITIPQNV